MAEFATPLLLIGIRASSATAAAAFADDQILAAQWMPFGAMSLEGVDVPRRIRVFVHVFELSDNAQMRGVDAFATAANVVDNHAGKYVSTGQADS